MGLAKRYILLILCTLLSFSLRAQQGAMSTLELLPTDDGSYLLTFRLGDVTIRPTTDGYASLLVDGLANLAPRKGLPALPQASLLLALPTGSNIMVDNLRSEHRTLHLADSISSPLAPYAGASVKDDLPPTTEADKEVYESLDWYRAGTEVEVENLGVMGDRQLFRLTAHPVAYLPSDNILILSTSISATITTTHYPLPSVNTAHPERYLIVSRPQFRDGLQPFVRWKRQQGYDVVECYSPTRACSDVKDLIHSYFDSQRPNEWPRYVLLVGDAGQLQAFPGTEQPDGLSSHPTDLYYAEHTGDYLPDALLGRWPVNDTAQLGAVVRKTLRYEQCHDLDTALLQRVLLVAGSENQNPAPVTTNGQVNYLGREIKTVHPDLDTTCYRNPASNGQRGAILQDIGRGAALLNYTAHCTNAGWSLPNVSFTSIDTLDASQPMVYVNNCCKSNDFSGTCFGEQLLCKPLSGAVGVIGATNSTLWNEDYYWAVGPKYPFSINPAYDATRPGAFDRWIGRSGGVQTLGELLAAGNLAVAAFGSPYDHFYWEIYCLLGDPTLCPWLGTPRQAMLQWSGEPSDGASHLSFIATPGATITALQGDTLVGLGIADDAGNVSIDLFRCLIPGPLVVTVSGAGLCPHVDTLTVQSVTDRGAALRAVSVTSNSIACCVENIGTLPLHHLRVTLDQPEVDSSTDALITGQPAVIDTLLPSQSHSVTLPVQMIATGQQPEWRAQLSVRDSNEDLLCYLTLRHTMDISYPTASFRLMEADNSETYGLKPQHAYLLETSVEGSTDNIDLTVTALPTGDTLSSLHSQSSILRPQFTTPDTLTHLHLQASLTLGNHHTAYDYYMIGGHRMDCFEEGVGSYPWQDGGTKPWTVDSSTSHSGHFCLRSGAIDYRQTSDLVIEVLMPQADSISFWIRTSTEPRYDKLMFSVDDVQRGTDLWGEMPWTRYAYLLSAGHHTLRWRYVKDESDSRGSDCVWIDDVTLPLALWDSDYGWFGDPTSLGIDDCSLSTTTAMLYPNPTTGIVTLEGSGTLHIFDLYGREVYSLPTIHHPLSTLHLDFLPDGLYILQLSDDSRHTTLKLIIQH